MLNMNASSENVVWTWRSPNRICLGFQTPICVAASRSALASAWRAATSRGARDGSPPRASSPNQPLPAAHVTSTANANSANSPSPSLRATSILPAAHAITGVRARRTNDAPSAHLDDAQWQEDLDRARGARAPLRSEAGEPPEGGAAPARVPRAEPEPQDPRARGRRARGVGV